MPSSGALYITTVADELEGEDEKKSLNFGISQASRMIGERPFWRAWSAVYIYPIRRKTPSFMAGI
jgi:hypothetical protein